MLVNLQDLTWILLIYHIILYCYFHFLTDGVGASGRSMIRTWDFALTKFANQPKTGLASKTIAHIVYSAVIVPYGCFRVTMVIFDNKGANLRKL